MGCSYCRIKAGLRARELVKSDPPSHVDNAHTQWLSGSDASPTVAGAAPELNSQGIRTGFPFHSLC